MATEEKSAVEDFGNSPQGLGGLGLPAKRASKPAGRALDPVGRAPTKLNELWSQLGGP